MMGRTKTVLLQRNRASIRKKSDSPPRRLWFGTGSGSDTVPREMQFDFPRFLLHPAGLALDEIHHDILAQTQTGRKISLAVCYLGHLFDEFDQIIIVSEHECINDDPRTAALCDFGESGLDDHRIEAHRVFI